MAEPARKLPPASGNRNRWQPRVIEGGGEGGDGSRPDLRAIQGGAGSHNIETPAQEEAAKKERHLHAVPPLGQDLNNLENAAATVNGAGKNPTDVAAQEKQGFYAKKTPEDEAKAQAKKALTDAKARSAGYRAAGGRRRGIFIGLGAGGGIISVIAGFSSLLPWRLPAILDTLVDDAGKRVEQVAERRAEKVFLQFILRGSNAAIANGNVIVTGNPIGDLFANMRTNKFEARLLSQHGLSFEPGPNRTVRLIHNGQSLGDVNNIDDINRILSQNGSLSRDDMRRIVRTQIPAWRFFKKIKFVRWLSIKYNIPQYGTRERDENQSDEERRRSVRRDHAERVTRANLENVNRFLECAGDDCPDRRVGDQVRGQLQEGMDEALDEMVDETDTDTNRSGGNTLIQRALQKIIGKAAAEAAGAYIPYVGIVILAAEAQHIIGELTEDNAKRLKELHAESIKRSTAVLGAAYAGYADQNKLGELDFDLAGMFGDNLNGWEESASYSLINDGTVNGQQLEPMEKASEAYDLPTWANFATTAYNTTGWVARAPLEAWYQLVNRPLYALSDLGLDVILWVMKFTPAAALLDALAPHLAHIMETFLKFLGMYVDPFSIGPRLAMFIHQGFLGAFNDNAKEMGMRKLTEAQALALDTQIRQERIAELSKSSLYDRLLNLDNSRSLATSLVAMMPAGPNPVSALAGGGMNMVANIPTNISRVTANRSIAAPASVTSESLFGLNMYGALDEDVEAPLHDSVSQATAPQCPENNDNSFNHCKYDRALVEAIGCSENPDCEDFKTSGAGVGEEEAGTAGNLPNDTKTLAQQILANKKITYWKSGDRAAKTDLERAAAGLEANSQCGGTVPLDPMLLKVILQAAEKYSFQINSMVSDHHCNQAMHPKGKAVDFDMVNGKKAITDNALYRQFALDLSGWMTTGGQINQKQCYGDYPAKNNVKTSYLGDPCNHLHMNVP